ncbi:uncharacterized protein CDV56_101821 [Aspergillus thermomutatus]|uniref:Uncharacterized protein n=1 Tax=Aspergillus thermomutatus TaxID=41047 RepID=A0A397G3R0_ASPTH|nr:uncharacterized protein CDV56_101821 [Aspergillus thermomutatus]RHZ45662.1 hypothetical protein CDV56_101821 [Aspergillus thermomutatus]
MSTSSVTDSSRDSYPDSPVSLSGHNLTINNPVFSFPVPQCRRTRRDIPKIHRYYSTPLRADSPDSTPLQMYGLEQREPSIYEKPRLLRRFSHALDDIKEDVSLQLDPNNVASKIRSRRQSMLMFDAAAASHHGVRPAALETPLHPLLRSLDPAHKPAESETVEFPVRVEEEEGFAGAAREHLSAELDRVVDGYLSNSAFKPYPIGLIHILPGATVSSIAMDLLSLSSRNI